MGKLTAVQVKSARPGRHADGDGLYLLVKPSGARSWMMRIVLHGRRRDFGLGGVSFEQPSPAVAELPIGQRTSLSLQEAREKATEGRRLVKAGRDPSVEWKRSNEAVPTFRKAAERYHEDAKAGWKNGKHRDQWLATLKAHAFPLIGATPVNEIDVTAIQSVLLPIWLTIPETARRVRQRIGVVLDYAHAQGWRGTEAPMRSVRRVLPKQPRKTGHFAAMPCSAVPGFMSVLRDKAPSIGRLALQLAIVTAARSGEVRGARWDEIDEKKALWTIPASRMKAGAEHVVPLSDLALTILAEARPLAGQSQLVFPGLKGKALSDMTLTKALRDADGGAVTVHGFRSSFRDWTAEQTRFPGEVAEAALAHTPPNKIEAAYRRTKFLDQRRKLMAAWAAYLAKTSNVVQMAAHR